MGALFNAASLKAATRLCCTNRGKDGLPLSPIFATKPLGSNYFSRVTPSRRSTNVLAVANYIYMKNIKFRAWGGQQLEHYEFVYFSLLAGGIEDDCIIADQRDYTGGQPTLLIRAGNDQTLRYPYHAQNVHNLLAPKHEYKVIEGLHHYAFSSPFPDTIASEVGEPAQDPEGFNCQQFLITLNKEITGFFLKAFK